MRICNQFVGLVEWFKPATAKVERPEQGLAQNFVFTHLFGPLLSQSIALFLYLSDPHPSFANWTVIVCIWLCWTLPPFVYKRTGNLQLSALISVELLAFTWLFDGVFYGEVSSPFLPWLIIALLLGFFYLSERPILVAGSFTLNIVGFLLAYLQWGFPQIVSQQPFATVGWISILSATIYMSWIASYHANMIAMQSDLEREAERRRQTDIRLREAKDLADVATRANAIFVTKISHELRTPLNSVSPNRNRLDANQAAAGVSKSDAPCGQAHARRNNQLAVQRRTSEAGHRTENHVLDSGIGIAPSDIGLLFQNFARANPATSSKYVGTGVGLALSQKLCALLGGGISATTALGQGSFFAIRLLAWMSQPYGDDEELSGNMPHIANSLAV